mmetsp:Transcript_8142/g.20450  ORF Transcript_8142/g.20450 Transcript_8142/m.20450 type:complete len:592 (+) Transcript_8142:171-1946(+)
MSSSSTAENDKLLGTAGAGAGAGGGGRTAEGGLLLSRIEDGLVENDDGNNGNNEEAVGTATQQQQQEHRRYQSVDDGNLGGRLRLASRFGGLKNNKQHRKHKSSLREIFEGRLLEPLGEEFQLTASAIGKTWDSKMESMSHSRTGFFDMSMTRSLSVLPDDLGVLLEDVVHPGAAFASASFRRGQEEEQEEEVWTGRRGDGGGGDVHPLLATPTTSEEPQDVEQKEPTSGPPIAQYLALLAAVSAVSSNSTALHMLDGVSAPLKLYWRMTASYCALLVPLGLQLYNQLKQQPQENPNSKDPNDQKEENRRWWWSTLLPRMNFSQWLTFVAAVFAYTTHNLLFYKALDYTTIGNAVIYANSQALLLIIAKGFVGEPIHPFEAVGVVVAFTGAILCSKDSESASEEGQDNNAESSSSSSTVPAIFGDMMALGAAVAGVAYLTFAKAVRPHMSVTTFMFLVLFSGSFLVLLYISLTDGTESLDWSTDPYTGVFGWLDISKEHHRLPVVLHLAVIVNMIGTMGFVRAMKYFENVVISVATLMEPLLASLIAYAFQIGLLPGPLGWVGNVLVIVGTLGVVYPSMGKGGSSSGSDMH